MYLEKGTEEKFPTIIKIPNMLQHIFCSVGLVRIMQIPIRHKYFYAMIVLSLYPVVFGDARIIVILTERNIFHLTFLFSLCQQNGFTFFFTFVIFNINNDNLRYDINTIQKDRTENTCNKNYVTLTLLRHNCVIVTFYVCCMMGRICN